MAALDGPRILPRQGPPQAVVVLLHGYGANGDDLIALGDEWRLRLRQTVFVAPNAPEPIPGYPGGLQWFELTFRDPGEFWRGVQAARPILDAFLQAEMARYDLPPERLALVGFSQGTMMALHAGLRHLPAPAAIVGFSGRLAGAEHLGREIIARPPTLLVHGTDDEVIAVEAMHTAREALAHAGVPVEWHERPGLGHGIDGVGLGLAGDFLQRAFG